MAEQRRKSLPVRIFSGAWRAITVLRIALSNLLFLALLVLIGILLAHFEVRPLPAKAGLLLAPSGKVVEQRSFIDPLTRLLNPDAERAETSLHDLVDAVDRAATDNRINSLVISLDDLDSIGISDTLELGRAIDRFKKTGKKVVAVGDNYDQQQYLLASYANEVYLNPMGSVTLQGYGVWRDYIKDALDKLDVDVHVFRVGKYKSALEPLMRNDMSDAAKEDNLRWLKVLWGYYTGTVADNRDLPAGSVDHYVNQLDEILAKFHGNTALAALEFGLIDGIKSRTEVTDYLKKVTGVDPETGSYEVVPFDDYLHHTARSMARRVPDTDKIAVVPAQGMIIDGDDPPGVIASDTYAGILKSIREDANVKAVVLRISSGGGSAFASEVIREQIKELQQAGKPVVVSMGAMAASGAYWVSAGADEIYAEPTTLTGSIGIFGAFPTINRLLERYGIHSDGVGTTTMSDAFRIDRPLSDAAAKVMQSTVDYGYERFVKLVANARGLTPERVNEIGQGRVWSGKDAKALGLVDKLGGLREALKSAAQLAGLRQYKVVWWNERHWMEQNFLQRFLQTTGKSFKSHILAWLGLDAVRAVRPLSSMPDWMTDPRGLYMDCEACTEL